MLQQALDQAIHYLLMQAAAGFPEVGHVMVFPHSAGFSGVAERQVGDLFARAVLAGLLLDSAEAGPAEAGWPAQFRAIARQEADYLAGRRLSDRAGGWSYFPELPELPPDVDSLAAVQTLFVRCAPVYLPLCEGPTNLALSRQQPSGALSTWLLAPQDPPTLRERMQWAIDTYWGDTADVDVCARFYLSLWLADGQAYQAQARRGAGFVASQQRPDGLWPASWYWGDLYSASLCLDLLAALDGEPISHQRALRAVLGLQRPDGGWGVWQSTPQETAVALWMLGKWGLPPARAQLMRGVECLLDWQGHAGQWSGTPWIKMEIGRAQGHIWRTATYQSDTLTTAFCVRALAQALREG